MWRDEPLRWHQHCKQHRRRCAHAETRWVHGRRWCARSRWHRGHRAPRHPV